MAKIARRMQTLTNLRNIQFPSLFRVRRKIFRLGFMRKGIEILCCAGIYLSSKLIYFNLTPQFLSFLDLAAVKYFLLIGHGFRLPL